MIKKIAIILCFVTALISCKKDSELTPDRMMVFDLGLRKGLAPTLYKTSDNSIIAGFNDLSSDSTPIYRIIKLSKEGVVEADKSFRIGDLFTGYTKLYSNITFIQEGKRLFIATQAVKENVETQPGEDLRPYVLIYELNEQFEFKTKTERKMRIGGLKITGKDPYFFRMEGNEILYLVNTTDASQRQIVYYEKTDLNGEPLLYKTFANNYWQKTCFSNSVFYAYGVQGSGREIYAYDLDGNLNWTHTMNYTSTTPDILIQKISMTLTSSQIVIVPRYDLGINGPIVTYSCDLSGQKMQETYLELNSINFMDHIGIESNVIYYSGKTCTGESTCKPFWAKTDLKGNLIFSKILPDDYTGDMRAFWVLEDESGYTLFGTKIDYSGNKPMCFILHTDLEGNVKNSN